MTGPEHYRKAEDLLRLAAETEDVKLAADAQQAAQVHATLALAAATAMASFRHTDGVIGMSKEDFELWNEACGA